MTFLSSAPRSRAAGKDFSEEEQEEAASHLAHFAQNPRVCNSGCSILHSVGRVRHQPDRPDKLDLRWGRAAGNSFTHLVQYVRGALVHLAQDADEDIVVHLPCRSSEGRGEDREGRGGGEEECAEGGREEQNLKKLWGVRKEAGAGSEGQEQEGGNK